MLEEPLPTVKIEPPFQENAASVANALVLDAYTTPFAVNDVRFVPPFATGSVPVTPVVKGNPVALVKTIADGVPNAGVTNVGLVANTTAPDPVVLANIVVVTVPVSPVVTNVPVTAGTAIVKLLAVFGPLSAT